MTCTTRTSETEDILVLYGSQRGTAEAAARRITKELPFALASRHADDPSCPATTLMDVIPTLMELDEWLESPTILTRLVILVVSSFGTGGAPMNARQFRRRCDSIRGTFQRQQDDGSNMAAANEDSRFLKGIHFCLLGLGDSSYKTTYMMNPQRTLDCFVAAGAKLVGTMGRADSFLGVEQQQKSIDDWMDSIWTPIYQVLQQPVTVSSKQLADATRIFQQG